MKKILATLLIVFTVTLCKAQWVTIPDANFVAFLQQNYPACMNGNQMNTNCSGIVNATYVDCAGENISNLNGIQYFDNLTTLFCYGNQLTSLPFLPSTLHVLVCYNNHLTNINSLPPSLTNLNIGFNQLTALPFLPNSLQGLTCSYNQISVLPTLPPSLNYLDCGNNLLTTLPSIPNSVTDLYFNNNQFTVSPSLPSSLINLVCSDNQLSSLPSLPSNMQGLYCQNNTLANLPSLPGSIKIINCNDNQITSLPSLPTSLIQLYCSSNLLTSIPPLPSSLTKLSCGDNSITVLPTLPNSLKVLYCENAQLISLPELPDTLNEFLVYNNPGLTCMPILNYFNGSYYNLAISNTGITCLPNVIQHSGSIPAIDTMPICSCTFPSSITTSNITSTSAKVNWSTECCSQFQIQKRVTGTTTWSTVTAVATATSKNLTALSPGTTYDLRMRVKCTDGTTYSSWSPIQTFTTLVTCVAPTGVTVTNLTPTHATINWAAVAGAYSYKFSGRKLGTTAWTTYTIYAPLTVKQLNGLTANTTYQYRMQTVCNASGVPTSPWTAISTFSTPLRLEDGSAENATIDFSIYPNPVSQLLTVTADFSIGDEIEIKDLFGRTLISSTTNYELSTTNYSIDVSNLSAAQYFISIRRNDGSVLIKQFVKN